MLQEITVDSEQMLIATENNIERTQWSLSGLGSCGQK